MSKQEQAKKPRKMTEDVKSDLSEDTQKGILMAYDQILELRTK